MAGAWIPTETSSVSMAVSTSMQSPVTGNEGS